MIIVFENGKVLCDLPCGLLFGTFIVIVFSHSLHDREMELMSVKVLLLNYASIW